MALEDLNINISTLNVRGLRDDAKRKVRFNWFRNQCADIIFLQETYVDKHISEKFGREWPGLHFHAFSSTNHSRGVSTLLSKNKNFKVTSHL